MTSNSKIITGLTLAMLVGIAALLFASDARQRSVLPEMIRDVAMIPVVSLTDFKLFDHQSRAIGLDDFTGGWSLVSFGYTHCPDVCPATLAQMSMLYKTLRSGNDDVILPRFYFISVDPDRDSPEYLGEYTRYFDPSFIGVTGENQALLAFEKQFGVRHRYIDKQNTDNYIVVHSAELFLINPQGQIVASFQPPMNVRQVASQYMGFVNRYTGQEI